MNFDLLILKNLYIQKDNYILNMMYNNFLQDKLNKMLIVHNNMFLKNYYIDLKEIAGLISNPAAQALYDAQLMTARVVCALCGGCLAAARGLCAFRHGGRHLREKRG